MIIILSLDFPFNTRRYRFGRPSHKIYHEPIRMLSKIQMVTGLP